VHLDLPLELLPDAYVLLAIELDDVAIEELTRMPADSASFGDDWLAEQRSPVLQVKLTRFRGHRTVWVQGVHDGQDKIALRT
jgi:hypothetical protein